MTVGGHVAPGGFSYAMNFLRDDPGDDRAAGLLAALYACAPVRSRP